MRKLMLSCIGCIAITLFVLAPSAFAVSLSSACQLQGTANFSPGLKTSSSGEKSDYSFVGTLSGCQSNESGVPTSGTIEAGQTLTEQVENYSTGATDTVTYQEPVPWLIGTCVSSSTYAGTVLETWPDGTHTVVRYTQKDGVLEGTVAPSMTLQPLNAQEGDPTQYEIQTNRFTVGESVEGLLVFQPSEPSACSTSAGATSAATSGAVSVLREAPKAPLCEGGLPVLCREGG